MFAWVGRFHANDLQAFLLSAKSLVTFVSFTSLLITSFHVFLGRPMGKLIQTLMFLQLLDQALSSIISR